MAERPSAEPWCTAVFDLPNLAKHLAASEPACGVLAYDSKAGLTEGSGELCGLDR